jgi:nucleoid-associated protein YgaU
MAAVMVTATPLDAQPVLPRPRLTLVPPPAVIRRRRLVVAGVLLAVIVLATLVVSRVATVLGDGPASVSGYRFGSVTYVVQPGDTLWSIARSLQPGGDVPSLVRVLSRANGGAELTVGQQLLVP